MKQKFLIQNQCCGVFGQSDFTSNFQTMAATWHMHSANWSSDEAQLLPECCCPQSWSNGSANFCFANDTNAFTKSCYDGYVWPQFGQYYFNFCIVVLSFSFGTLALCVSWVCQKNNFSKIFDFYKIIRKIGYSRKNREKSQKFSSSVQQYFKRKFTNFCNFVK